MLVARAGRCRGPLKPAEVAQTSTEQHSRLVLRVTRVRGCWPRLHSYGRRSCWQPHKEQKIRQICCCRTYGEWAAAGSADAQWARGVTAAGLAGGVGVPFTAGGGDSDWLHHIVSLRECPHLTTPRECPISSPGDSNVYGVTGRCCRHRRSRRQKCWQGRPGNEPTCRYPISLKTSAGRGCIKWQARRPA